MPNDALLTSLEAGRLLNKSARTVQRMAERGDLPYARKLPGHRGAYLFHSSEIVAIAKAQVAALTSALAEVGAA